MTCRKLTKEEYNALPPETTAFQTKTDCEDQCGHCCQQAPSNSYLGGSCNVISGREECERCDSPGDPCGRWITESCDIGVYQGYPCGLAYIPNSICLASSPAGFPFANPAVNGGRFNMAQFPHNGNEGQAYGYRRSNNVGNELVIYPMCGSFYMYWYGGEVEPGYFDENAGTWVQAKIAFISEFLGRGDGCLSSLGNVTVTLWKGQFSATTPGAPAPGSEPIQTFTVNFTYGDGPLDEDACN